VSLFEKFKAILKRKPDIDFDDIEEFLIENNFGVKFTERFIEEINEVRPKNPSEFLKKKIAEILDSVDASLDLNGHPVVFSFVGTNGSGKTTSIAKIANLFKKQGKKVLLIAGDTFRAAAIEQLTKWANRLDVPIVKQQIGSDPASVVFDGLESAFKKGVDVVLIDSAGRVETKKNLMNELSKLQKVIEKKIGRPANEVLLVLDAYTGQNAVEQVEVFSSAVKLTGIVLTKLDGSSSGGIIVPIVEEYKIPIKFIGTGESVEDLQYFDTNRYIEQLM
jgi:fused signal recognition particle receptor